ncbi:MAG: hypothetical protein ACRDRV_09480 [Pseudonocardiaceae bacterium]
MEIWERGIREPPLERALTLLAAATGSSVAEVATVDVGSREVLLARLLESAIGGLGWAQACCAACGEQLDVPVDVAAIARSPVHEVGEVMQTVVDESAVSFRLPTTADLRTLRDADPAQARRLLLTRCLQGEGIEATAVSDKVADAVDAAMEQASPCGAIEIVVACPGCGTVTPSALDVSVLLWAEVEARAVALLHDVHALATAYGWTEADVLALSPQRRAAYLNLAST